MKKRFVAVSILLLLAFVPVLAQVNAGLSGTVSDSSGALIPGVEVTAKNVNTGITDFSKFGFAIGHSVSTGIQQCCRDARAD